MRETGRGKSEIPPGTLRARYGVDGDEVVFGDYVEHGDQVELYRDPGNEQGFFDLVVVEWDGTEWVARPLTHDENMARTERILERRGDG